MFGINSFAKSHQMCNEELGFRMMSHVNLSYLFNFATLLSALLSILLSVNICVLFIVNRYVILAYFLQDPVFVQ